MAKAPANSTQTAQPKGVHRATREIRDLTYDRAMSATTAAAAWIEGRLSDLCHLLCTAMDPCDDHRHFPMGYAPAVSCRACPGWAQEPRLTRHANNWEAR